MLMSDKDSTDISDVLRRSYKFKWTILLLAIASVLAIRATLTTGLDRLKEVNKKSVESRTKWYAEFHTPISDPRLSLPEVSLIADEAELAMFTLLSPLLKSDPKATEVAAKFERRAVELNDLIEQRRRCFDFSVAVPGTKADVTLNALWILEIWPFGVLFLTIFLLVVNARQRTFEIIQAHVIQNDNSDLSGIAAARADFLGGKLEEISQGGTTALVYKRNAALLPEPLLTFGLWCFFVYSCFSLFPSVDFPNSYGSDSTLWGIHTLFVVGMTIAALSLWHSWRFYDLQVINVLKRPVLHRWSKARRWLQTLGSNKQLHAIALALIVISLFIPWDSPSNLRGGQFFWIQKPTKISGSLVFFSVPPRIFHEFQFQLAIAMFLILFSLVARITRRRFRWVSWISRVLSLASVVLIANMLAYWTLLDFRSDRETVRAAMTMIFGSDGITGPRALPLVFHEPAFGIWLFMLSLLFICLYELDASNQSVGPL